jgi:hypothetical protein
MKDLLLSVGVGASVQWDGGTRDGGEQLLWLACREPERIIQYITSGIWVSETNAPESAGCRVRRHDAAKNSLRWEFISKGVVCDHTNPVDKVQSTRRRRHGLR